jgi:hypothetical protein
MKRFPSSVHSRALVAAGVVIALSATLGCSDGRDDGGANAHVCEGDRWSSEATMREELARCTRITGNLSITGSAGSIEIKDNLDSCPGS